MWSNAAALRQVGLSAADWWLREQPAFDLNVRLSTVATEQLDALVRDAARRAAARGVVGIGDFEFDDAPAAWLRWFGDGFRGLRVRAQVYPAHLEAALAAAAAKDAEVQALAAGAAYAGEADPYRKPADEDDEADMADDETRPA